MSYYNNFIGLRELHEEARSIMRNYSIIAMLLNFAFSLTGTFSILYIIDAVGFKDAATLTAISLVVVLFTDYPSGSLGDWIGQKFVIMIALGFFTAGFFLMSLATVFNDFAIVAVLLGLGQAQASGALESWLDNAYKQVDETVDPDRKNYGYSMSRIQALTAMVSGVTFILGGYYATRYSREAAFQLQSVMMVLVAILVIKLLSNQPTLEIVNEDAVKTESSSFLTFLKGGFGFLFSSRKAFFFIMGLALFQVIWTIWGALLLFPAYFGYTGSDSALGMMRSAIFFAGVFTQVALSSATKKVDNNKLVYFVVIHVVLLFLGGILMMRVLPMENEFNWIGVLLTFAWMFVSVSLLAPFVWTMIQREMVDLVPSENRNAIYSLIPTISSAIAIPILPSIGEIVQNQGLEAGFLIMFGISTVVIFFLWISINMSEKKIDNPIVQLDPVVTAGN